ncbi:MAG: AMP-binding protein [Gammaproteobacteria bacterium]
MTDSYVSGTRDPPLLFKTVSAILEDAAERWGERDALVSCHQKLRLTYTELNEAADRLAAGFVRLGLQAGDCVGIWSPNRAEWVVTQFATARAGLILVTVNPAYRVSELTFALNKVGCKALVLASRCKSSDYVAMLRQLAPELDTCAPGQLRSKTLPHLRALILIDGEVPAGFLSYDDVEHSGRPADYARLRQLRGTLQPDDAINVQFTSGTTGEPKGATLTHHNIVNNGFFVAEQMLLTAADRLCIPVPLYHCFGMVMAVLGCVTHGAALVFPAEVFDPESVLKAISAERCTALFGVPTMFIAELGHANFSRYDLSSLRTGCMAGAPCPIEVMKRVITDMHLRDVTIAYGMTETSPVSFQSRTDDPIERRVSTVGRIHPHLEVKIVDEEGRIVPRGTSGELLTRGYSVMRGYWDEPVKTRESIDASGWMRTGDLGVIDVDGYCNIVGRLKDLIVRGGENISPREIEDFLFTHPHIQSVAVFGVPDEKFGEAVCAWIRPRPGAGVTESDILDFCRDRIAHFKVPRHIRFVDDFPMTVTGKIQKFVMREQMKAELGVAEAATA